MLKFHLIRCTISRGGFSSERTFEITTPSGKLVGTSDVEHLLDSNFAPLNEDVPPFGEETEGFVKCRVIRQLNKNEVLVDLPSSDVVHVSQGELQEMAC